MPSLHGDSVVFLVLAELTK